MTETTPSAVMTSLPSRFCVETLSLATTTHDETGRPVTTEQRYVRFEDFEAALDAAEDLRRTIALAHMHLVLGGPLIGREAAVARIQADTGLTLADAQAMASIIEGLRSSVPSGSAPDQTPDTVTP